MSLQGTIADRLSLPPRDEALLTIRVGEDEVHVVTMGEAAPPIGAEVWLSFKRYHVFDETSGRRLSSHGGKPN